MTEEFPAPKGSPVFVKDPGAGPHASRPSVPVPDVAASNGPGNPAPPASSLQPLRFMGRGTMSRQLVLRVTLLVAAVAITLSSVTAGVLHRLLEAQLDQQLVSVAKRVQKVDRDDFGRDALDCAGGEHGGPGQQQGLLIACSAVVVGRLEVSANGLLQLDNTSIELSDTQVSQLLAVTSTEPVTIPVDELGAYRVLVTNDNGRKVVIGLPNAMVSDPVSKLIFASTLLTLTAIAIAILAARSVVQNSLRPLRRLANTAHVVSQLELHSGEVDVPVRVPETDTDPRSEVGQVSLAFNHMLDNVEGALDARQRSETRVRQFVADASHELRNPLASIRGYAELTRRERDEVPPTTAHALARIESESNRMSALVEDMLLLARLDTGPNYLTLRPVPMNELVANAVSDAQAAGHDHEWELSLPETEVVASGDAFRLHQVIANLLSNARTHTPAGTNVRTSLTAEQGQAVISVSDNGPGIPPAIRDRVFERFTRADASRVRSGKGQSTGLGLAIVAAVVGAHHGSATVSSDDQGTTFTVRIPLADAQHATAKQPQRG